MKEPVLSQKDIEIWDKWKRECLIWSMTNIHKSRINRAKYHAISMYKSNPYAYMAVSGGKDSTVMMHLVSSLKLGIKSMSIKDDMDYPGEKEYITKTANFMGVELDIIEPNFSLQDWLSVNGDAYSIDSNFHGRMSEFSQKAFYSIVESYSNNEGRPGVYLGLRSHESKGRAANRASHGPIYKKNNGETVCQPICDFEDRDVYAYAFSNKIELFDVYRCVRLADNPAKVRKSWWLPGTSSHHGLYWLKIYYPSLYLKLCRWFTDGRQKT